MSATADAWDLTVPDDPTELLAELRRHGIEPGKRLFVLTDNGHQPDGDEFRAAMTTMSKGIERATSQGSVRVASMLGPPLEALQEATKAVSMSELAAQAAENDDSQFADALEQLRNSLAAAIASANKSQASADAVPARPRRTLAFAACFSSERNLACNIDDHLSRGFGRP